MKATTLHLLFSIVITATRRGLAFIQEDDDYPCGIPAVEPEIPNEQRVRIVNGWEANAHSVPWQVRVISSIADSMQAMCGGSLIQVTKDNGTDLVLTAAHCVHSTLGYVDPSAIEVTVGAHDLHTSGPYQKTITAMSMMGDPGDHSFEPTSINNDFVVIRLREMVPYTNHTRPICLPKHNEPLPFGKTCYVTGWGTTSANKSTWPHILMQASAKIIPYEECYEDMNNKTMVCAGLLGKEMSACFGDSGGPLACNVNNTWVQYGIVSWGRKCASPKYPVVYTHVPYFARRIGLIGKFLREITG